MFLHEVVLTKVDENGLEYTSERGFADFCYEFLKTVGAATTGDIMEHIKNDFELLEGDEVKTSEKRSAPRYRQMVDNLLKSHGSILRMYPDLRDFPGGIALDTVEISEEVLERARGEMSTAAKQAEARRLKEQERIRENNERINAQAKIVRLAKTNASMWRLDILTAVRMAGIDVEEAKEDFDDIVEDIAYRKTEIVDNKEQMIKAFISEL